MNAWNREQPAGTSLRIFSRLGREPVSELLIGKADKENFKLAPFIGIAYPDVINSDGSIDKGARNQPGNWERSKSDLPASLVYPQIGEDETAIVMHSHGVVQGLSEIPFMQDVKRWGVLTIGTGLGNAPFTNRNGKAEK